MSLLQFSGLFVVWLLCTLFIATLTWFEFRRVRALTSMSSFHCCFCSPFSSASR